LVSGPKGSKGQNATLDRLTTAQGKKHNLDAVALQSCVRAQDEKAVRVSQKEGEKMGVSATPEMFVNGRKVDGALPIENLRAAFDRAIQDAGLAPTDQKASAGDAK
jgi:protein-disulfide isomerase